MGYLMVHLMPDGTRVVEPPFAAEVWMEVLLWIRQFDCAETLTLEAPNGEPVTYEYIRAELWRDAVLFRRKVDI